jgi:hypothetical protein
MTSIRAAVRLAALAFALAGLDPAPAAAQFDTPNRSFHNRTSFPLDGRHQDVACESCHRQGVYQGTPARCFDCHWTRRQDDRYRLQLGSQCEQCHRTTSWTAVRWEHGAMTGMPLNVAHRTLTCESCHQRNSFQTAQTNCVSCHRGDYDAARSPNHVAAGFPLTCETCHRPNHASFSQATFDHAASFPLVGVHARQTCATCHKTGMSAGTPRDCVGCHRSAYERTTSPNHAAAGFPTTCENCHRPTDTSFRGASFNHSAVFSLVGRHAQTACASCHINNVYRGTARDCVGCHRSAYDRTTTPNHAAAGFPTTCESCHRATDTSWNQGTFNHRFRITSGPHRQPCATCHQTSSMQTFTCLVCHQHSRARMDDKHKERTGYRYDSLACYSCHPTGRGG